MPKIVDHEQYRKSLVFKSFDLFAEKGYAITMRQIAQGLGVSTGTLYHYFPSKEALFEQLVIALSERDLSIASDQIKPANTLAERIAAGFEYVEQNKAYLFKQMMVWMDFCQHQNRAGKATYSASLEQVEAKVMTAIAELLGIEDPDLLMFISSLVDGLIVGQIYDSPVSITRQGQLLVKMLTAYLEAEQLEAKSGAGTKSG
jgi:AcrR family transcriptional regulator